MNDDTHAGTTDEMRAALEAEIEKRYQDRIQGRHHFRNGFYFCIDYMTQKHAAQVASVEFDGSAFTQWYCAAQSSEATALGQDQAYKSARWQHERTAQAYEARIKEEENAAIRMAAEAVWAEKERDEALARIEKLRAALENNCECANTECECEACRCDQCHALAEDDADQTKGQKP